jgi:hypothetical protein
VSNTFISSRNPQVDGQSRRRSRRGFATRPIPSGASGTAEAVPLPKTLIKAAIRKNIHASFLRGVNLFGAEAESLDCGAIWAYDPRNLYGACSELPSPGGRLTPNQLPSRKSIHEDRTGSSTFALLSMSLFLFLQHDFSSPRFLGNEPLHLPRPAPLRQALGRLWAALLRRFAAAVESRVPSSLTLALQYSPQKHIRPDPRSGTGAGGGDRVRVYCGAKFW